MHKTITALAVLASAASGASWAQTTSFTLGHQFITPDRLAEMSSAYAPATAPANSAPANDQTAAKLLAAATKPVSPATPTAPAAPTTPAAGPNATAVATTMLPPAVDPAPIQRYIEDADSNQNRIAYYEAQGEAKLAGYASTYGFASPDRSRLAQHPEQIDRLSNAIRRLRARGVEEGKISMELNRMTLAQFIRWTEAVQ